MNIKRRIDDHLPDEPLQWDDATSQPRALKEHLAAAPDLDALEAIVPPLTAVAPMTDELCKIDEKVLNEAAWKFIDNAPENSITDVLWNNLKAALRPAIELYLAKAAPAAPVPEWFKYDVDSDVAEIYGMKYTRALFEEFAGVMPLDAAFKIVKRENGVLTVMRVSEPAAPVQTSTLVPKWAGEFRSYQDWVNKAQARLASPDHRRAMCVDAKGRRCAIGKDFMLARDEGAFPVRYFWECELAAPVQAEKAQAEPVAWLEAEPSARGEDPKNVAWSILYSSRIHTKCAPMTSNPVWPLYAAPVAALPAQAEQAAAVRAVEWISVEDRLPELDVPVWLWKQGESAWVGGRSDGGDGWLWCHCHDMHYQRPDGTWDSSEMDADDDYQPTHWTPLPGAPSTGQASNQKGDAE